MRIIALLSILTLACASNSDLAGADPRPNFSGIYPHLAFFNDENECGTGAVVPWADRLWAITYAPHKPRGSTDKLYEIDRDLNLTVREESVGGTPANRMVHRESGQLFIGPYAIDPQRKVRVIPYAQMPGRPTGNARHLTDPEGKIYYATMEEGFYEVDVKTLEVTTLFADTHVRGEHPRMALPGYHGKGLYSGGGRVIYANNGEAGAAAMRDPFVPSGVLGEWRGKGDWQVVLRNQFTEVTGPGGIYGSSKPETDPVWSIGWDAKSLLLMCLEGGEWHRYRLPKASHSYDGAHGWNTEWPRVREIGEGDELLMTMHGMFWRFPKKFSSGSSAGIRPRSSYLKVIGDFCRWGEHVVLGCDDTAKSEFLNKRRAKGEIAAPQSQSNLWFVEPERLDQLGPGIGRGAVWLEDEVAAGQPSDPFLFAGFKKRGVHISTSSPTEIQFELDVSGNGRWKPTGEWQIDGDTWIGFADELEGAWMRARSSAGQEKLTVAFTLGGEDLRPVAPAPQKFTGLAEAGEQDITGGIVRARGENKRTLHFASDAGYYELGADAKLRHVEDETAHSWLTQNAAIPSREGVLTADDASVLYIDDKDRHWRLPKGDPAFDHEGPLGLGRLCREVATERDLFNCHGTFYELPAENAGGFARVRPVSTHNRRIKDYCSYRGLLVLSGIDRDAPASDHIVRSGDGKTALWLGAIDDIWELGKPVGQGGPWKETRVKAGEISDPYLMTGFDQKRLTLTAKAPTTVTVEIDITGTGHWNNYASFDLEEQMEFTFPTGFQAYWIRFRSSAEGIVTAQLRYF